jgi:hypothetical protein
LVVSEVWVQAGVVLVEVASAGLEAAVVEAVVVVAAEEEGVVVVVEEGAVEEEAADVRILNVEPTSLA